MYIIFASDDYIASNPETVQKMVTAIAKAIKWFNDESRTAEEIAEAVMPLFEGKEDEVNYSVGIIMDQGVMTEYGYHTEEGFAAANVLAKLCGLIEEDVPAEGIYNETFLDNAWAEIGK